jgi:hypothetical protein
MKWDNYYRIFLQLEDELIAILNEVDFYGNEKMYSHKLSLLLLRTCPIIESYMVEVATKSNTVFNHQLFNWEYNYKLWDRKKSTNSIDHGGEYRYRITSFPKFTYVIHEVFNICDKALTFFKYSRIQDVENGTISIKPFSSFSSVLSYREFDAEPRSFPVGYNTPTWWTAYNKIKHDLNESKKRVNYETVVTALGGLLLVLVSCDPDFEVIQNNQLIINNYFQTRQFQIILVSD